MYRTYTRVQYVQHPGILLVYAYGLGKFLYKRSVCGVISVDIISSVFFYFIYLNVTFYDVCVCVCVCVCARVYNVVSTRVQRLTNIYGFLRRTE
jgi:hypothetical protein